MNSPKFKKWHLAFFILFLSCCVSLFTLKQASLCALFFLLFFSFIMTYAFIHLLFVKNGSKVYNIIFIYCTTFICLMAFCLLIPLGSLYYAIFTEVNTGEVLSMAQLLSDQLVFYILWLIICYMLCSPIYISFTSNTSYYKENTANIQTNFHQFNTAYSNIVNPINGKKLSYYSRYLDPPFNTQLKEKQTIMPTMNGETYLDLFFKEDHEL